MFDVKDGISFAIHHLESCFPGLTPAHSLHLAQRYNIPKWVPAATRALIIHTPLANIDDEDITYMGVKSYSIIARAKDMLSRQRIALAQSPPGPPILQQSPQCSSHTSCVQVWQERWVLVIGRAILSPTTPLPLTNILDRLKGTKFPGMNEFCHLATMKRLSVEDFSRFEQAIMDKTIDMISKYHGISTTD